ncbi:DUF1804 family protein, partial [Glaesserella parasuis]|nr:DUF1804 family protein [Glaesserella parasuis]MCT8749262.1 DUF1804 family protein [Glaesserella parasuis]
SELAVAMKTVELLGEFIKEKHPNLFGDFLDVLGDFGEVVDKAFRKGK